MREGSVEFETKVLKEAGRDGETADEDAGGHFGGGPEAHAEDVIAGIG